jgi:hypothetical protein
MWKREAGPARLQKRPDLVTMRDEHRAQRRRPRLAPVDGSVRGAGVEEGAGGGGASDIALVRVPGVSVR